LKNLPTPLRGLTLNGLLAPVFYPTLIPFLRFCDGPLRVFPPLSILHKTFFSRFTLNNLGPHKVADLNAHPNLLVPRVTFPFLKVSLKECFSTTQSCYPPTVCKRLLRPLFQLASKALIEYFSPSPFPLYCRVSFPIRPFSWKAFTHTIPVITRSSFEQPHPTPWPF